MILAPGDAQLLLSLFTYRCLTSGQLARRHARSTQVVRRAIRRRLKPGGFVVSLQRSPTEEAAYTLGPAGIAFMAHELGCPVPDVPFPRTGTSRGIFWRHSMLIIEVRIAFDLATESAESLICIERTIPEWEVNPAVRRNAPHHERFVLSERFKSPDGSTTYWHRPDCLFLMRAKDDGARQRVAAFLEADRNTEAMRRIRQKYEAYWMYWSRRRFVDAFDAVAMRVLFVLDDVTDRRRIRSMQDDLREFTKTKGADAEAFRRCFRFALRRELDETTVMAKPIWRDADDQARLFFQPARQSPREAGDEVAA